MKRYPSVSFGIKASEQNFACSGKIIAVPLYSVIRIGHILGSLELTIQRVIILFASNSLVPFSHVLTFFRN
jgi:hypothetical protein